jgi:hypothetical protein
MVAAGVLAGFFCTTTIIHFLNHSLKSGNKKDILMRPPLPSKTLEYSYNHGKSNQRIQHQTTRQAGMATFCKLQRSAADLEILSAARFSAAGVLALQHFAAAALRFTAAALRCRAKKHKRCSAALQR